MRERPLISISLILLSLLFATHLKAEKVIKQFSLDEYVVYTIPVPFKEGVTTVLFPSAIDALRAGRTSTYPSKLADFYLTYQPGNFYFSIKALKPDASDVLTIVYNRKAYVLRLQASEKPFYTVTFFTPHASGKGKSVSPAKLVSLLDKAKAYELLAAHHPEAIAGVDYFKPARIMRYHNFRVFLDEVWRFEEADTIIFHINLENLSDELIRFKPEDLSVRVGDRIYCQSIADASGVIPPRTTIPAYFAITGTPAGGRNNLSVRNNWNILVPHL